MEGEETPQYYYDSSAHQWWIFNVAKGEWELCPESEQTGFASEPTVEAPQEQQQQHQQQQQQQQQEQEQTPAATQPGAEADASQAAAPAAARPSAAASTAAADAAAATAANAAAATAANAAATAATAADAAAAADSGASERPSSPSSVGVNFEDTSQGRKNVDVNRGVDTSLGFGSPGSASRSSEEKESDDSASEDALGSALERLMTTTVSRGFSGPTSAASSFSLRQAAAGEESGSTSSDEGSGGHTPPPSEPIVRRVTRCMTLMDQGGLADCIQKAVEMRQHIIDTEKGGHVPGAEDTETKEEAWKIRARARAKTAGAEARQRAQIRWRAAALEVAAQQQQQQQQQRRQTPDARAQRFADIVGLVAAARKKGLVSPGPAGGSPHRRATELPLLSSGAMAPVWNERRGTDVLGRIRFADVTLSDPTNQQQISGLMGSPRTRRHTAFAKPFLTPNPKP